jgi:hypothetical protein
MPASAPALLPPPLELALEPDALELLLPEPVPALLDFLSLPQAAATNVSPTTTAKICHWRLRMRMCCSPGLRILTFGH